MRALILNVGRNAYGVLRLLRNLFQLVFLMLVTIIRYIRLHLLLHLPLLCRLPPLPHNLLHPLFRLLVMTTMTVKVMVLMSPVEGVEMETKRFINDRFLVAMTIGMTMGIMTAMMVTMMVMKITVTMTIMGDHGEDHGDHDGDQGDHDGDHGDHEGDH